MRHDPALVRAARLPAVHAQDCRCALCAPISALARAALGRVAFGRGGSLEAHATSIGLRAAGVALLLMPGRALVAAMGGVL